MSYNYSTYADDSNQTNSGSDNGSSGSGDAPDLTLSVVPHAAIEGDLTKVFGTENAFGQSIGIRMENVELVDGCLYHDPEKGKHKIFSWKDVVGISPEDADDLSADQANQYLMKTYGTTEKRYELVKAVVPEVDEAVEIGDAIIWYGGSEEYGPKSASRTLAQILTTHGRDMVIPEEDVEGKYIEGWLADTSVENVLRPDLQDRRVAFFEVKKDSNQSDRQYHHPIVVDAETGQQVTLQNATEKSTTAGTLGDSEDAADAQPAATDGGAVAVPEPISDFISTCDSLGFTDEDRAAQLLTDLVADEGNDLTADMIDEFGGEDAILGEVAE